MRRRRRPLSPVFLVDLPDFLLHGAGGSRAQCAIDSDASALPPATRQLATRTARTAAQSRLSRRHPLPRSAARALAHAADATARTGETLSGWRRRQRRAACACVDGPAVAAGRLPAASAGPQAAATRHNRHAGYSRTWVSWPWWRCVRSLRGGSDSVPTCSESLTPLHPHTNQAQWCAHRSARTYPDVVARPVRRPASRRRSSRRSSRLCAPAAATAATRPRRRRLRAA